MELQLIKILDWSIIGGGKAQDTDDTVYHVPHVDGATKSTWVEKLEGLYVLDAVRILWVLGLGASHDQEVSQDLDIGLRHACIVDGQELVYQGQLLDVGVRADLLRVHLGEGHVVELLLLVRLVCFRCLRHVDLLELL